MSISAENTQSWLAQHANSSLVGADLPWLQQQRQQALARFEKVGLPGIRDEEWRYTNLRALKSNTYLPGVAQQNVVLDTTLLATSDNPRMVFVDGFFNANLSSLDNLDGQITFTSMAHALDQHADLLQRYLGSSLSGEQHGFTELNSANWQDGYLLIVPKNAVLKTPLEVVFVASQASQDEVQAISHTRNLIVTEAHSECVLVERHIGAPDSVYLNNSLTEIHAGDSSHVDHYKLQQESNEAFHIGGVFVQQAANSNVKNHNIALSGLVTRNDINVDLNGQGAHLEMNGLVLGSGRQHVDNHTEVNHAVPNCTSDEYYKTILDDSSRSIFRGRIIVAQDAQQTSADQQNNNLLLSKDAEADCKPQLEIYADDVQCSHGATVGQLDPASLFYLRSRGIDNQSARGLLTFAFANQVIERIKVGSIREELTQHIAGQLLAGLEDLV